MLSILVHSFLLICSVLLTYLWTQDPRLASYNLQAVGVVVILYFICRFLIKKERLNLTLDIIILTCISLLIILATGGVNSPFFFLIYFLMFGVSLLFEPLQAITLSLSLIFILAHNHKFLINNNGLINLIALIITTPIALIFGRYYLKTMEDAGKIKRLNQIIRTEETETLTWLSTATPTLINLLDLTSQIIASNLLPFKFQQRLKELHLDLIALHHSAKDLEEEIDNQDE